jgi:hypothetical protein
MSVRIFSFIADSVADRDSGPGTVLILGSGIRIRDGKKSGSGIKSGSGMNNFWVKILKFFDADPDPESFRPWIRDGKIRIRDPELISRIRNTA